MTFLSARADGSFREEYDVIVVGAGPAGSTAAKYAAAAGADVLLIDRKREIGSPVQCAGFVPEAHELSALIPAFKIPAEMKNIPDRCILNRTSAQRIVAPDLRTLSFGVDGLVLDRRLFDAWLADEAAAAGADILCGTTVRDIRNDRLTLSGLSGKRTVSGKIIIGADGPLSPTAKAAGLLHEKRMAAPANAEIGTTAVPPWAGRPPERGIGFEYKMTGADADEDALEMYFGNAYVPGGYAWIFPEGGSRVNVGIGLRRSLCRDGVSAKAYLDRFIREHPAASAKLRNAKVTSVIAGVIPVDGAPEKTAAGCTMIAGDAAGHVLATNGGGIPFALSGGMIAGQTAADVVSGNAVIEDYDRRWRESFGAALDASVKARMLMDRFMASDKMMNAAFRLLPADRMKEMQCGHMPPAVAHALDLLGKTFPRHRNPE